MHNYICNTCVITYIIRTLLRAVYLDNMHVAITVITVIASVITLHYNYFDPYHIYTY